MSYRRLSLASLFAVALALPAAGSARAEDKPAPPAATDADGQIKQILLDLDTAQKAKDESALVALAKKAPPLYKSTQDAALKASLMKGLGAMIKNPKLSSARKAGLAAITETEDGKEAWKVIAGAYPSDDVEDPDRFNLEFIKAVGALHPDGAIDRLLETFRKSKQNDAAGEAVEALGNYHKSKQREHVLEEIVKAGRNMVPSSSGSAAASPETVARWGAVGPKVGAALDMLTGDNVKDPVAWFKKYNDSKKNLKALFKD